MKRREKLNLAIVSVSGIGLNVEFEGQGPPVFMLHGFTGDVSTWYSLADRLRGQYTTVLVDLIGHGQSDAPGDLERYPMERCVEDLLALADHMGIEEAVWLGYSMGGRVCLSLGVTAPERCRALVVEGASGGIEDESERAARVSEDGELAKRIEDEGVGWFVNYWESQALFASQERLDAEAKVRLRRQRLGNRAAGLANSLKGMGTGAQPCVYDRLSEFRKPVLFLAGEEDKKFVELGRCMSGFVPNGKFELIRHAGHCAHLENPREFEARVWEFLDSIDGELIVEPVPGARGRSAV